MSTSESLTDAEILEQAKEQGEEAFFDAVADSPEMTDGQKALWLHICATEYYQRWQVDAQALAALRASNARLRAVVEAARALPDPMFYTHRRGYECCICGAREQHRPSFKHHDGCCWLALRVALAALDEEPPA